MPMYSDIVPSANTDLPPTDFSCWTSHVAWSVSSKSIVQGKESDKTKVTLTSMITTQIGDYTASHPTAQTTLCDGYPRVTGNETPTGSAPTSVVTLSSTWVSTWVLLDHQNSDICADIASDASESNMHY